jgi:biotin carboxyl carrier protein
VTVEVRSPAVGTVVEVLVAVGDAVAVDQEIAVVESMKVEIPVLAPSAGVVTALPVAAGQLVQAGDALVTLRA